MYGKMAYGNFGSILVKLSIMLNNFTACCAFFKIFGKVSNTLVGIIVEKDSFFVTNQRNYFYVIILFFAMMPLIFKKSIDAFKVNAIPYTIPNFYFLF